MTLVFDWTALRALTPGPGTGGALRRESADFQVRELPLYAPSGEGDFLYLEVEKVGHTTAHLLRVLAPALGVREKDIGVAGLKDRHAVTTQWLSLPMRAGARLDALELPGVRVLQAGRHGNRLGLGHLRANRFRVRVRGAPGTAAQAQERLEVLVARGVPNYFGPQRFGLGGLNAEEGLRVLRGESRLRDPRVRRFLTSAVQSALFNRFLSLRIERDLFAGLLRGDMAKKHDTGGVFEVEDPAAEAPRAARGEVSATGTLFGRKIRPLRHEAGDLEVEALGGFGLTPDLFASRKGDRRLTRVYLEDAAVEDAEDGYWLAFTLPRGAFATSVLREVLGAAVDTPEGDETEAEEVEA